MRENLHVKRPTRSHISQVLEFPPDFILFYQFVHTTFNIVLFQSSVYTSFNHLLILRVLATSSFAVLYLH